MELDDDSLKIFLEENDELLQEMEALLMSLEDDPTDQEQLAGLFRTAHTIKGSSSMFGFALVVSFTHEIESLLDDMRKGKQQLDSAHITALLPCVDHIKALIEFELQAVSESPEHLAPLKQQFVDQSEDLLAKLGLSSQAAPENTNKIIASAEPAANKFRVYVKFHQDVLRDGMDPASFVRYLAKKGEITGLKTEFDALPDISELNAECCYIDYFFIYTTALTEQEVNQAFEFVEQGSDIRVCALPPSPLAKSRPKKENLEPVAVKKTASDRTSTLRIDADRLDHLIDLVGELVIAGANNTMLAKQAGVRGIIDSTETVSRLIEEIRDSSLNLRMVPIGQTFNRFRRTVRDISENLGKDITLALSGEDTELDRSVVEKLGDPLMHMLRNAIDHGIEDGELRVQKGKPACGTIGINARHESGWIVIEVQDDGGGLDKKRILAKAIERGLTSVDAPLSDCEIFQFIFAPAFSTAHAVSAISGRGVGMDVVRKNIEALRGNIEVDSTPDVGTTMRIRLPLTLAIIDGFLVKVGTNAYVIPLENIIECMEIDAGSTSNNTSNSICGYTNLRGELLPYLRLRGLFQQQSDQANHQLSHQSLVVVSYGQERAGIIVDELLGEFQTVIKPLGQIFTKVSWITGSTILGTGEVAVILDVAGLIKMSKSYQTESAA